jgi:hypothetical protein
MQSGVEELIPGGYAPVVSNVASITTVSWDAGFMSPHAVDHCPNGDQCEPLDPAAVWVPTGYGF